MAAGAPAVDEQADWPLAEELVLDMTDELAIIADVVEAMDEECDSDAAVRDDTSFAEIELSRGANSLATEVARR